MEAVTEEPQPLSRSAVLERFKKCRKVGGPIAARYRRTATVNENYVQGNQWAAGLYQGDSSLRESWFDDEGIPRIYVNECQGLMTTWSALLNKDRRSAVSEPVGDDLDAIYDAEIVNKMIEYVIGEQNTASKIHQAVQYSFQDGTAGLKILFDRKKQVVKWSPLTIHTYFIDPKPDMEDVEWVVFENPYGEDEVAEMWADNNIEGQPPQETAFTNAAGEQVYGILGNEFWHRPNKEFPAGFYACVIADQVVELMEYPLVRPTDGEPEYLLPCVLMKVRTVRDSAYGITPLTDIVPLQRSLNENVSRIQALIRQITKIYLVLPKVLQAELDLKPDTLALGFDDTDRGVAAANAIKFTQAGIIPAQVFEQRDYFRSMMNEVAGLNDVTVGSENRTLSGKAMENLFELDKQKNADAAKSLEDMVLAAWRLCLAQMQLFFSQMRQQKIAGVSASAIASFRDVDIQGVKLRLQTASEFDKLDSVEEAAALEGVQTGTSTMGDLEKARKTPGYGMSRRMAEELIAQYLAGGDIDVEPDDLDLAVFSDIAGRAMTAAMNEGRREDWKALAALRRWVKQELVPAQGEAAPIAEQPAEQPAPEGQPQ